ncbi:MAG TPA: glycosyltransferase family 2 protein [Candidatus Omnitrophota bacterium]|nr:glycosyltransferase family 2 protein [Candidatus Omnitrophota bacterium]HPT07569.1 glycosyltransferase family 2 protein [Candidatus Omnitrophota bacterium]
MNTCVVIPVYNESKKIADITKKLRALGLPVVVVDDGSRDDSALLSEQQGAIVLKNARNLGKGASLCRGFEYAVQNGFDAVITMDGDGQHDVAEVPVFIQAAENSQSGLYIGDRMTKSKGMPPERYMTNRLMSALISMVAGQKINDSQCGFRLLKKELLKKLSLQTKNFEIESEMIIQTCRLGFTCESIPIRTLYGSQKSKINPCLDTWRFICFITRQLWITKHSEK